MHRVAAAAVGVVALALAAPAYADVETVVTQRDPAGDVRIFKAAKGLSKADRRSVDIRRVTVKRVDRKARVVVRIKDVRRVEKFDQMVFATLTERPGTEPSPWETQVGFTTKGNDLYPYAIITDAEDPERYRWCDDIPVTVRPKRNTVAATVPRRCTPTGEVRVKVRTYTGTFRSDAPPWSTDFVRVPGFHQIL
jgi:hypothetical protein